MRFIATFEKWSARVFTLAGTVCLVGIVLVIMLNVVLRFVFNLPLMWYLELCTIFVVWLAFLPIGANYLLNRHFIIDTFVCLLPKKYVPVQRFVADVACLGCTLLLAVSAMDAIEVNGGMELTMIPVSLTYAAYLPVVIGAVSHFVFIVLKYVKLCTGSGNERTSA